jgi:hypothetical protein
MSSLRDFSSSQIDLLQSFHAFSVPKSRRDVIFIVVLQLFHAFSVPKIPKGCDFYSKGCSLK